MPGAIDNGYRWILRPLLFRMSPERAQAVADYVLARSALSRVLGSGLQMRNGRLFVELCGVTLENPVGLAAGYDKNCEMVGGLSRLGFGYLTVGTVTETPRPGNDAPRLLRLPKEESLLNALGFPGAGLEAAAAALERSRDAAGGTLLIVSVAGTAVGRVRAVPPQAGAAGRRCRAQYQLAQHERAEGVPGARGPRPADRRH